MADLSKPLSPGTVDSSGSGSGALGASGSRNLVQKAGMGVTLVLGLLAVMWVVEGIDTVLSHRLDRFGVRPHSVGGFTHIPLAPFLHAGWGHLLSNSLPFAILGIVVAIQSTARFVMVAGIVTIVSGLGMWLLGSSNSVHLGASGVVFGLLTYLIARGFFARNILHIVVGIAVGFLYGSILWGVLPTASGVSWQGHLFGAIGGVLAAYLLDSKKLRKPKGAVS